MRKEEPAPLNDSLRGPKIAAAQLNSRGANCIAPRLQSWDTATDGHGQRVWPRIGSTDARHAGWHPVAERVSRIIDVAGQLISWAQAIEKTPHASMALREPAFVSSQVIKTRPRPTGCVAYVSNSRRAVDALPFRCSDGRTPSYRLERSASWLPGQCRARQRRRLREQLLHPLSKSIAGCNQIDLPNYCDDR